MLRKRWLKWAAISLGVFLVAAGTARSVRTRRALEALQRVESRAEPQTAQHPASKVTGHAGHAGHAAQAKPADAVPSHEHMEAHMKWTGPRRVTASDEVRAQQIVDTLRQSLEPYRDYKAAVRAGYYPFAPDVPQRMYHLTHGGRAVRNAFGFDATRPTSLLYQKTEKGLELIGAMYTAPRRFTEEQLDERIPLSIGRWHQHVNICLPPAGVAREQADWTRFGPNGSIASEKECADAGGRWRPNVFGWMIHVYPYQHAREKIWTH